MFTALMLMQSAPARAARGPGVDFMIPGVSLEEVDFTAGSRVAYLVISRTYGVDDSSLVELAVLDFSAEGIELEILSAPYSGRGEESVRIRLSLAPHFQKVKSPGEFYSCLRELRIQEGTGPFREPTREEIGDFDLDRLFLKQSRESKPTELAPRIMTTPAGSYTCRGYNFFFSDSSRVSMGGLEAVRREEESSLLWLCDSIPFWGLVKSEVKRTSHTSVGSPSPRRVSRPKVTLTDSILLSWESRKKRQSIDGE
ncbi:MAG: hypothetical protein JXB45_06310 [Candidatus Krumholzibacteriota bacterium]|nr:hypothetical protein [Candidatus Krumholzibacteriota bacterium]